MLTGKNNLEKSLRRLIFPSPPTYQLARRASRGDLPQIPQLLGDVFVSSNLQTLQLKPNPSGKDRSRYGGASATQLGAEWVDVKNISSSSVDLTGVKLCHIAYSVGSNRGQWDEVIGFRGTLGAGNVIRVHSGSGPESFLRDEDKRGVDHHLFTNRDNYVWNNDHGDCSALFQGNCSEPFDKACYDPNPPEGVVLKRVGDRLIAQSAAVSFR
jgi:hypothetical protein